MVHIITEIQSDCHSATLSTISRGGAGRGAQGSGPPSPDQGHLCESPRSNEFLGVGWGSTVACVCQWAAGKFGNTMSQLTVTSHRATHKLYTLWKHAYFTRRKCVVCLPRYQQVNVYTATGVLEHGN